MSTSQTFENGELGLSIRKKINSVFQYNPEYFYNSGDICFNLDNLYIALSDNPSNEPSENNLMPGQWKRIGSYFTTLYDNSRPSYAGDTRSPLFIVTGTIAIGAGLLLNGIYSSAYISSNSGLQYVSQDNPSYVIDPFSVSGVSIKYNNIEYYNNNSLQINNVGYFMAEGTEVLNIDNYTLYSAQYSQPSVCWNARTLNDNPGYYQNPNVTTVCWSNNSSNPLSLNDFYGSSVKWGSRQLLDHYQNISVDWDYKFLNDSSSVKSIDWSQRKVYDSNGQTAISWGNYSASNNNAQTTLDWNNCLLNSTGNNPSYKVSIDWLNRELHSSVSLGQTPRGSTMSVDWNNRLLYSFSGPTPTETLDWQNCTLTGNNWTANGFKSNSYFSADGSSGISTTIDFIKPGATTGHMTFKNGLLVLIT